jgi:hypothetical protein
MTSIVTTSGRIHQREELHAVLAGGGPDHRGHEDITQFAECLETAGNQLLACKSAKRNQADHHHRNQHVGRGIGEGDRVTADVPDDEDVVDVELVDRIEGHERGSLPS